MVEMATGMDHGRVRLATTNDDDDGDDDGDDVAQHGGHPANTKSCGLRSQHISLILDKNKHIMISWQLSYWESFWPVSRNHIAGSGLGLIEVTFFFLEVDQADQMLDFFGSRAHVKLTCEKNGQDSSEAG